MAFPKASPQAQGADQSALSEDEPQDQDRSSAELVSSHLASVPATAPESVSATKSAVSKPKTGGRPTLTRIK